MGRTKRGDALFAQVQAGKEKSDRSLNKLKQIGKVRDVGSIENSKRSLQMEERLPYTETAYYGQRITNRRQSYYYQEELSGEDNAPIQCRKSDFYRGGAELEHKGNCAELEFGFEGAEKWPPDLLREGIKGVSFDHVMVNENKIGLHGADWNLTVELMGFNPASIESAQKTAITLELIVGGPTGTKLSELPKAAEKAAEEIKKMDGHGGKELIFAFNEKVFQTVADNIIRHYESQAEGKMKVIKEMYPALYSEYQCAASRFITSHQKGDDTETCISSTAPPLPPTLEQRSQTESHGLLSSKKSDQDMGDLEKGLEMLRLVAEDLKKNQKVEMLKKSKFSMAAKVKLPTGALSGVDWGLQVTMGIPVTDIPGMIEKLLELTGTTRAFSDTESNHTVSEEMLRHKLQSHNYQKAYDHYLKGLAEIISAYRRGLACAESAGPKHSMRLVNKNPLDKIILNMEAVGTSEERQAILETCVDMISYNNENLEWNWEGAKLSVKDWSQKMKGESPVDLVSVYDRAYRHGQIGQLSELNEAGMWQVPVFEFRELSSIKLDQLRPLFEQVVKYFSESQTCF
ncbi:MAG: hypothetical protein K2K74_07335 [Lachnospiraceae bacterium]|nr:hypothetical protein [Lachnospiraceae bacterium]